MFVHSRNGTVKTATTLKETAAAENGSDEFRPEESPELGAAQKQVSTSMNTSSTFNTRRSPPVHTSGRQLSLQASERPLSSWVWYPSRWNATSGSHSCREALLPRTHQGPGVHCHASLGRQPASTCRGYKGLDKEMNYSAQSYCYSDHCLFHRGLSFMMPRKVLLLILAF